MNLLNQCQLWTDRGEDKKIIEAVEALPEAERTPRLLSELGRAYNNLGAETPACYEKALAILSPLAAALHDDYRWNFRMGYAYYHLGEEGPALRYFRKALEARPGDEEAEHFLREGSHRLVCPLFDKPFRVRAEEAWQAFAAQEAELCALIDRSTASEDASEALRRRLGGLLGGAIRGVPFDVGREEGQYVLVLLPEGGPVRLWKIVRFLASAPAGLAERWRFRVGRPAVRDAAALGEAAVQAERTDGGWIFRIASPSLAGLPAEQAQAAAGFFLWRPEDAPPAYRSMQRVREALTAWIEEKAGPDAVIFTGWAEGLYAGYLDCIAWDLQPVLDAAETFFRQAGFRQGGFHTFRRRVPTVYFFTDETPAEKNAAPRKSILTDDVVRQLEACIEDSSGYFGRMFQILQSWLAQGIAEGRFTAAEAQADRDTALWYAYACCNLEAYEWYYRAAQWMPASEAQAAGCGMWYYRYSVALMGCGRLEEARTYAERGTREEPDYPWIWLQAAKLRSHFGDRTGALEAVERGLFLEPGDYEFRTLRAEILRGASLEEMEYHWIDPASDQVLQEGQDDGADEKQRALLCLTTDEAALQEIAALFPQEGAEWDAPYCRFFCTVGGHPVDLVFCMNRAGLSKLKIGWLRRLREKMDSGAWLTRPADGGDEGLLAAVIVGLDYSVRLRYIPSMSDAIFDASPDGTPRKAAASGDDRSAAVLLRGGTWDRDALIEALTAAGYGAETDGDDAVMASAGGLTAVLCFYPRTHEGAGLPAHQSHVTAAVVGSGDAGAARRLLTEALLACAALPDAAAVLVGGACLSPEAWRAQADNFNF